MNKLRACITKLRKLSSERERDVLHLRLNGKLDQAIETGEEMDFINDAIYFLEEYAITLNAFRIVRNHLCLTKTEQDQE